MKVNFPLLPGIALVIAGCAYAAFQDPPWPLLIIAIGIFLASQMIRWNEDDALLYRALAAIPLSITITAVSFWAGVISMGGILMIILTREKVAGTGKEVFFLLAAVFTVFLLGVCIDLSNHMPAPFIGIIGGACTITGYLFFREYRLQRLLKGVQS